LKQNVDQADPLYNILKFIGHTESIYYTACT
jgi:hypothetical protein